MNAAPDIWADAPLIHSYSRADALEDGVIVDLRQDELGTLCDEAGFRIPIACTARVFFECIALTPSAARAHNDMKGRLWDVLWMLKNAIRGARDTSTVRFQLYVVRDRERPTLTTLIATVGPGDEGEPVLTILFPDED